MAIKLKIGFQRKTVQIGSVDFYWNPLIDPGGVKNTSGEEFRDITTTADQTLIESSRGSQQIVNPSHVRYSSLK